jgi:DNA-binding CsgD family transcriptional regulator
MEHLVRRVGRAAKTVLAAHDQPQLLTRTFEASPVPMVMVDDGRRYVQVNRPARLWFRLKVEEMRRFTIGDLTPAPEDGRLEHAWARLLHAGCLAGHYPVYGSDGSVLDVAFHGFARILPGLHLIAFAPADWSAEELGVIKQDYSAGHALLTPRELDVLALAADGLSAPELAEALVLSPATIATHFKNIYAKLGVANRAAAVAKAMRLGLVV